MKQKQTSFRLLTCVLAVVMLLSVLALGAAAGGNRITLHSPGDRVGIHTELQAQALAVHYNSINNYAKGLEELSRPVPVTLTWEVSGDVTGPFTVMVSENKDLTDAIVLIADECTADVWNLKIGTNYYWSVSFEEGGATVESEVGHFFTDPQGPRNLFVDGVTNVRDLGGKKTDDGMMLKQGLIYRTGRLNTNNSHWNEITPEGIRVMVEDLGMKTEIDLRSVETTALPKEAKGEIKEVNGELVYYGGKNPTEANFFYLGGYYYYAGKGGKLIVDQTVSLEGNSCLQGGTYTFDAQGRLLDPPERNLIEISENGHLDGSPLGDGVKYYVCPLDAIDSFAFNKEEMRNVFTILADEANYPLFFHCKIGTDRTGIVAILVGGICGVNEADLLYDYLFSNFGKINNKRTIDNIYADYLRSIENYEGATFAEKCYNYCKTEVGIPTSQLDSIIRILKEEIPVCTEHTLVHVDAKKASCTESGWEAYDYCQYCDYTTYKEISAFGHCPTGKAGAITCSRCGVSIDWTNPFADVGAKKWYFESVRYVNVQGLMEGSSATKFNPEKSLTRAELVAVLWRLDGSKAAPNATFRDFRAGQWYSDAVSWAAYNDVVSGIGNGRFNPSGKVTREQIASILCRYAEYKGYSWTKADDLSAFKDKKVVSSWAKKGVQKAIAYGLIKGASKPDGLYINPLGEATRAEVAAILNRFVEDNVIG